MSNAVSNSSGVQYTVVFVNNSADTGNACIYQQDPNITDPKVMSLAWLTKGAAPTTTVTLTWTIDYSFVWAQTGTLKPGVLFMASQVWPADLSTTNEVTFTQKGGIYTFQSQQKGPESGNLYIKEDSTIPEADVAVGVGMSGAGTFVQQGELNKTLIFTPHPEYWITFGTHTQGEVMDITDISNPAQIQFPTNVYSMTATLNADNTWTIMPTAQANARYLESRKNFGWGQHQARTLPSVPRE